MMADAILPIASDTKIYQIMPVSFVRENSARDRYTIKDKPINAQWSPTFLSLWFFDICIGSATSDIVVAEIIVIIPKIFICLFFKLFVNEWLYPKTVTTFCSKTVNEHTQRNLWYWNYTNLVIIFNRNVNICDNQERSFFTKNKKSPPHPQ